MKNYWDHIKDAIGRGNFADLANSAALDDSAVCDCEAEEISFGPSINGWYLGPLHTVNDIPVPLGGAYPDWGYCLAEEEAPHDIYGVYFHVYNPSLTFGTVKPTNPPAPFSQTPDVEMQKTNSQGFVMGTAYIAAANQPAYDLIVREGLGCEQFTNNNIISISDVLNTPVASKGDYTGFSMSVQKNAGASGTVSFRWAWLHNINSPSHA